MANEARCATIEFVEVFIIPKRGGDVGEDKAKSCPKQDDNEAINALCEEKVNEEAEAQANVRVKRHWPLFEKVVENGTLPKTDEGTTYAVIIVGCGDDNEAESEAEGDCDDAIHRK
jgi:hypothetical protein